MALASAETVYGARVHDAGLADAASATGAGVFAVTLAGAVLGALALLVVLPRGGGRLPPLPEPVVPNLTREPVAHA